MQLLAAREALEWGSRERALGEETKNRKRVGFSVETGIHDLANNSVRHSSEHKKHVASCKQSAMRYSSSTSSVHAKREL